METGSIQHPRASRYFITPPETAIRNSLAAIEKISRTVSAQVQFLGISGQSLSMTLDQLVHKAKKMQEEGENQLEDIERLQLRHLAHIKSRLTENQTEEVVEESSSPPFGMYL